jgi:hypothetical protein
MHKVVELDAAVVFPTTSGNNLRRTGFLKLLPTLLVNGVTKNDLTVPPPGTLSACLLIEDNNEILNEWTAYHYHAWNLHHLVVVVDPSSSQMSPSRALRRWRENFLMTVEVWTDKDYMPDFFVNQQYHKVPNENAEWKRNCFIALESSRFFVAGDQQSSHSTIKVS